MRVALGAVFLVLAVLTLLSTRAYFRVGFPSGAWWLLVAISLFLLPQELDIAFGRSWGFRSPAVVLVLAAAAAILDLIFYRNLWGPPLGLVFYLLSGLVLGFFALALLVGGIGGVPGCEMRAFAVVLGRMSGREVATHY